MLRIYGRRSDKQWSLLLRDKCPVCKAPLIDKKSGLECAMVQQGACKFFITHEKAEALKTKLKQEKKNRRILGHE